MIHRKVKAAGASTPLSIVLVYIAGQLGLELPPEVAAALASLVATGAGWFARS